MKRFALAPQLALAALVLVAQATPASATSVNTAPPTVRGERGAAPASAINVSLHGGPVVAGSVNVYAIFWESHAVDASYDSYVQQFLSDVGNSSAMGALASYSGPGIGGSPSGSPGPAVTLAGTWHDTVNALPTGRGIAPKVVKQIAAEVARGIAANSWPTSPGNVVMVFTGPGYQANFTSPDCGFHNMTAVSGVQVPFTFVPRPGIPACVPQNSFGLPINPTPSGSVRQDGAVNTTWHELAEMLTDPLLNGYFDSTSGQEIADPCENRFPGLTGTDNHDAVLNGHDYIIQAVWLQPVKKCALIPALAGPWTDFAFYGAQSTAVTVNVDAGAGGTYLEVTDAFCRGDRFTVVDGSTSLGMTSSVPNPGCGTANETTDPDVAFADPTYSSRSFYLTPGTHTISIVVQTNATGTVTGDAFYRYS